jgi:hypothetical protein
MNGADILCAPDPGVLGDVVRHGRLLGFNMPRFGCGLGRRSCILSPWRGVRSRGTLSLAPVHVSGTRRSR